MTRDRDETERRSPGVTTPVGARSASIPAVLRSRRRREAGVGAIEIIILVVIFGAIAIKTSEVLSRSSTAQKSLTLREILDERLRKNSEQMANRLRQVGTGMVVGVPMHPDTSTSIRFRRLVNYDLSRGPEWGNEERIAFVPPGDRSETGMLVWDPGTGAGPIPWCTDITAVEFSREGRRLRFVLEATAMSPDGDHVRVRRSTDVTMQN